VLFKKLLKDTRRLSHLQIRLTKAAILIADVASMLFAGFIAAVFAKSIGEVNGSGWLVSQDVQRYWAWLVIVLLGVLFFLVRFKHYTDRKPYWTELGEVMRVLLMLAVLDLAVLAITRWNSSRLWWAFVWLAASMLLPIGRSMARRVMRRLYVWQRPTLIVGAGPNAHEALAALQSEWTLGFDVQGFVDVAQISADVPQRTLQLNGEAWPVFSGAVLADWAKVSGVQFVVAMEHGQNDLRENVLRQLAHWRAEDVSVIPAMRGVPLYGTDISYFFSHEVALLKLRNNLRYWPARLLKRFFDVLASVVILLVLLPLFVYLAMTIRKDGGPAIFSHRRVGQSGQMFNCYKFRSMRVDAEEQLRDILASSHELREEWEREFKLKDDPRISNIGQFLRRTSLDELPQIFNVIKGDMSLVGPRPVIKAELARYGDDVDYFLMVRPGMTGLWQVSGRNNVDYDTRVYLDTWYVKNWSLWYDIAILFKTIKVVFKREGAY
jgi:Undecaprenyl-phosphate galactose phosphotransferase WbaP